MEPEVKVGLGVVLDREGIEVSMDRGIEKALCENRRLRESDNESIDVGAAVSGPGRFGGFERLFEVFERVILQGNEVICVGKVLVPVFVGLRVRWRDGRCSDV